MFVQSYPNIHNARVAQPYGRSPYNPNGRLPSNSNGSPVFARNNAMMEDDWKPREANTQLKSLRKVSPTTSHHHKINDNSYLECSEEMSSAKQPNNRILSPTFECDQNKGFVRQYHEEEDDISINSIDAVTTSSEFIKNIFRMPKNAVRASNNEHLAYREDYYDHQNIRFFEPIYNHATIKNRPMVTPFQGSGNTSTTTGCIPMNNPAVRGVQPDMMMPPFHNEVRQNQVPRTRFNSQMESQPNIFKRQKVDEVVEHNISAQNMSYEQIEESKYDEPAKPKTRVNFEKPEKQQISERESAAQRFKKTLRNSPVKKMTKPPTPSLPAESPEKVKPKRKRPIAHPGEENGISILESDSDSDLRSRGSSESLSSIESPEFYNRGRQQSESESPTKTRTRKTKNNITLINSSGLNTSMNQTKRSYKKSKKGKGGKKKKVTAKVASNAKPSELRKCKFCEKKFTRQGLGGHMSRAHPGQSEDYKKKKETRHGREDDLRLLRLAQDVYRQRFNAHEVKGTDMNRTKLNKIREEIKEFYEQNPGQKFPNGE